jgi:Response regulators consisting of a CheY-like receiver domain and a winged-helix DNA-binding domain
MFNILVAEDDLKLNKLFCTVLVRNGYRALSAADGEEALDILAKEHVDLIISDIMMPNMNGYDLTKALRDAEYNLPVLMVTAREDFEAKEKGFLVGTDDYMIKPINVNEMLLRVRALLRRAQIVNERKIEFNDTVLNYDSLTVTINGEETLLPQKEFQMLYKLLSYPNKIFTRQQIMDEIWGLDTESDERTVDVHINRLRERFRDCDNFQIITIRGLGYKAVKKA